LYLAILVVGFLRFLGSGPLIGSLLFPGMVTFGYGTAFSGGIFVSPIFIVMFLHATFGALQSRQ
jgi:hypothetical protein